MDFLGNEEDLSVSSDVGGEKVESRGVVGESTEGQRIVEKVGGMKKFSTSPQSPLSGSPISINTSGIATSLARPYSPGVCSTKMVNGMTGSGTTGWNGTSLQEKNSSETNRNGICQRVDLEPMYSALKFLIGDQWTEYKQALGEFVLGKRGQEEFSRVMESIIGIDGRKFRLHNQLLCAIAYNCGEESVGQGVADWVASSDNKYLGNSHGRCETTGEKEEADELIQRKLKQEIMNLPARDRHRIKSILKEPVEKGVPACIDYHDNMQIHMPDMSVVSMSGCSTTNWEPEVRKRYTQPLFVESSDLPDEEALHARIEPLCYEEGLVGGCTRGCRELMSIAIDMYMKQALSRFFSRVRHLSDGSEQNEYLQCGVYKRQRDGEEEDNGDDDGRMLRGRLHGISSSGRRERNFDDNNYPYRRTGMGNETDASLTQYGENNSTTDQRLNKGNNPQFNSYNMVYTDGSMQQSTLSVADLKLCIQMGDSFFRHVPFLERFIFEQSTLGSDSDESSTTSNSDELMEQRFTDGLNSESAFSMYSVPGASGSTSAGAKEGRFTGIGLHPGSGSVNPGAGTESETIFEQTHFEAGTGDADKTGSGSRKNGQAGTGAAQISEEGDTDGEFDEDAEDISRVGPNGEKSSGGVRKKDGSVSRKDCEEIGWIGSTCSDQMELNALLDDCISI